MQRSCYVAGSQVAIYRWIVRLAFWVYTVENSCLVGVTYIANVENYRKELIKFVTFFILLGDSNVCFLLASICISKKQIYFFQSGAGELMTLEIFLQLGIGNLIS